MATGKSEGDICQLKRAPQWDDLTFEWSRQRFVCTGHSGFCVYVYAWIRVTTSIQEDFTYHHRDNSTFEVVVRFAFCYFSYKEIETIMTLWHCRYCAYFYSHHKWIIRVLGQIFGWVFPFSTFNPCPLSWHDATLILKKLDSLAQLYAHRIAALILCP